MKNKKLLLLYLFNLISIFVTSQTIKRDPDYRKDYANVFYKPQYTLFDLWSDEPIYPDGNKIYHIYYATNEDKTPKELNGTGYQLSGYQVYKFKNYENCKNWCDGVAYKVNSSKYTISSSQIKPSEIKKVPEDSFSDAIRMTAEANKGKAIKKEPEKYGCIEGDCVNGYGVYKYPDGKTYSGNFVNGMANGWGSLRNSNTLLKKGYWKDGNYVVNDSKTDSSVTNQQDGCLSGDCENGFGEMRYFNGDKYSGNFISGLRNGYGEYKYASGRDSQKGEWKNGDFIGEKSNSKELVSSTSSNSQNESVSSNNKSKIQIDKKTGLPVGWEKMSVKEISDWVDNTPEGKKYAAKMIDGVFDMALQDAYSSSSNSSSSYKHNQKTCSRCNKEVLKPSLKNNPRCETEWKKITKLGYVLCSRCGGYGYLVTNLHCDCIDGIGWCFDKVCPNNCDNGWVKCDICKGTGY